MNYSKIITWIIVVYILMIAISTAVLLIFFKEGFACGWIVDFVECSPQEAVMENIIAWGGTYAIFFLVPSLTILIIIYLLQKNKK